VWSWFDVNEKSWPWPPLGVAGLAPFASAENATISYFPNLPPWNAAGTATSNAALFLPTVAGLYGTRPRCSACFERVS